jgi:hypothetical protein
VVMQAQVELKLSVIVGQDTGLANVSLSSSSTGSLESSIFVSLASHLPNLCAVVWEREVGACLNFCQFKLSDTAFRRIVPFSLP